MRLSACIIMRDAAEDLEECLESLKDEVDEIVVVDTGSEDNSVEIAHRYTDKVYFFRWRDDFAAARNYCLEHASGDWIFFPDADEYLSHETRRNLRRAAMEMDAHGIGLAEVCIGSVDEEDGHGFGPDTFAQRLFRNDPLLRYRDAVHEHLEYEGEGKVKQGILPKEVLYIRHKGYSPARMQRKILRNLRMLEAAEARGEDKLYLDYYLAGMYYAVKDYEKAVPHAQKAAEEGNVPRYDLFGAWRLWLNSLKAMRASDGERMQVYQRVLEACPKVPDFHADYGILLANAGRTEEAWKELCTAERLMGEFAGNFPMQRDALAKNRGPFYRAMSTVALIAGNEEQSRRCEEMARQADLEKEGKMAMDKAPEISLIIPVYNAKEFYRRCFDSIAKQTFRDFEVIVVDDCSTDGSLELIRESWPKNAPPCLFLRNEKNEGPSAARNRGIEAARGKYLGFIDSDDAIDPGYLALLHRLAEEGYDYAACGARMVLQDGTAKLYTNNAFSSEGWRSVLELVEHNVFNLVTWGSLIRRSIVTEHGIRFTRGAYEDVFFNFRVLMCCRRAVVAADMLYDYYDREDSLSVDPFNANCDYVDSFCTLLPMVEEFLSQSGEKLGMKAADAVRVRKYFLRLLLHNLKVTAQRAGEERYGEQLEQRLKKYFGDGVAYLYIHTLTELHREDRDMKQLRNMSEQVDQLRKQVGFYESVLPSLRSLQRRRMMIDALLNVTDDVPLAVFQNQPWYEDYWKLVRSSTDFPEAARWENDVREHILAWMKGKPPVRQQFGALALLLCAPVSEVRPCIRQELWTERLKGDFRALEGMIPQKPET